MTATYTRMMTTTVAPRVDENPFLPVAKSIQSIELKLTPECLRVRVALSFIRLIGDFGGNFEVLNPSPEWHFFF